MADYAIEADHRHQAKLDRAFSFNQAGHSVLNRIDPANLRMRVIVGIMASICVLVLWAAPDDAPKPADQGSQVDPLQPSKLDKEDKPTTLDITLEEFISGKQGKQG